MEPKPTFTWKGHGLGPFRLSPDDPQYESYGIVIYRPYGSASFPWNAVSDYESDYPDYIAMGDDLDSMKEAAEKRWFTLYLDR
jgi:hypothetical protein